MYNLIDMHLHSKYSWDAQQTLPEIIRKAKDNNYKYIGITEHVDFFDFHPKKYDKFEYALLTKDIEKIKKDFRGIRKGAEIGEPHLFPDRFKEFLEGREFDYLVGSIHHVNNVTPVYDKYFHSYSSFEEAYRVYFKEVLALVTFGGFDVAAHLDIVHRRGANFYKEYSYGKFKSEIDEILKVIIDKNIGLEINTSGLRFNAKDILPTADIVKAYIDMGGDIITVGSDAHTLKDIFFGIEKAYEILEGIGVKELTVFEKRKAEKIPLRRPEAEGQRPK